MSLNSLISQILDNYLKVGLYGIFLTNSESLASFSTIAPVIIDLAAERESKTILNFSLLIIIDSSGLRSFSSVLALPNIVAALNASAVQSFVNTPLFQ